MTSGTADFKNLISALHAGNAEQVMRSAHTIKGASGNLGLSDVYKTAGLIEIPGREIRLDDLNRTVEIMQSQFEAYRPRWATEGAGPEIIARLPRKNP